MLKLVSIRDCFCALCYAIENDLIISPNIHDFFTIGGHSHRNLSQEGF